MRRLFFLLAALAVLAVNLWALEYKKVDKVPVETYITDIQFDAKTNILSFTDNYKQGSLYDRKYIIYFYEWIESGSHETGIYKVTNSDKESSYVYGYPIMKTASEIACISITDIRHGGHRVEKETDAVNSIGGAYSVDISNEIERVLEKGKTKLRIVVNVLVNENGFYICPETGKGYNEGKDQNCFVNCYTGRFSYNDLYVREPRLYEHPERVFYGDSVRVSAMIKGTGQTTYYLQEGNDQESWRTVASGSIPGKQVRELSMMKLGAPFEEEGRAAKYWYRLVLEDNLSHVTDTSNYLEFEFFYPWKDGEHTRTFPPGAQFDYTPAECEHYSLISSLPVKQTKIGSKVRFTQPACPVEIKRTEAIYNVSFYNADNTIISVSATKCGEDAVAPPDPSYGGYEFTGWSRDLTNVHSDMSVIARYDIGNDYDLRVTMDEHKNEVFPFDDFEGSETRAMIGDVLTFNAGIFATLDASLYYQTAQWNNSQQKWIWADEQKVGDYTANTTGLLTQNITVCYNANTKYISPFENRLAVRFCLILNGMRVYSDPFEYDVYYPTGIKTATAAGVIAENNAGDLNVGTPIMLPARNGDTIRVYGMNGSGGGCFSYKRVIKPAMPVDNGVDGEDNAYFIAPGELDTIVVSVSKTTVVFEVTGQGKPEYSAYGSNVYYAEEVDCGGAVAQMPIDPKEAGYYFIGWKSWNDSEYPDDAYLHVPAGQTLIGFTAQWEDIPDIATHKVKFLDKDGNLLGSEQDVLDGGDAVPPTPPTVTGYNFIGWDKPYTCITADVTIQAMYGLADTYWTVTYYDEDGKTKLSEETVADKMPANGTKLYKEGGTFKHWLDMATSQEADLASIIADMSVKAVFEWPTPPPPTEPNYYKVTLVAEHGKISVKETGIDLSKVEENTVLHFTATPDEDYEFKSWKNYDPATGLTVTEDVTVTAFFEKKAQEGLEEVTGDGLQVTGKVLINGQLYILRGDKVYNASGVRVKE